MNNSLNRSLSEASKKKRDRSRAPIPQDSITLPVLEDGLQNELILARYVVGIGSRDGTEGSVAKGLVSAVVVRDVEVRRVGDVERLDPELDVQTLRGGKVFEERQVDVPEVGSNQRVALRVADRSQGLRREGGRVEELVNGLVAHTGAANRVRTVGSTTVLVDRTVVEPVRGAVAFNRVISTRAAIDDAEWLAGLPDSDGVHLPSVQGA